MIVNGKKLESMSDINTIHSEDQVYPTKDVFSDNTDGWGFDSYTEQQGPFRIKYHPSYNKNRWMVVEGSLGKERKYPVILDTGASLGLFVNDIHIIENKLTIYPQSHSYDSSVGWGTCHVPELNIGQLTLVDWPCYYREQHMEIQLFGIPLARDKAVIAGLETLQKFKYIAFDSIKKEVELSPNDAFQPEHPDLWTKYPFSIEEDLGGNVSLIVKIPIAGQEVELQLDTGSGRGLAISEDLWEQMSKKFRNVKLRKARDLYPYIGLLLCKRGIAAELEIGNRKVKNAMISVFPEDSPIVDQCQGMLGMQYFQDTVMVLDFEQNLMWIKNSSCL